MSPAELRIGNWVAKDGYAHCISSGSEIDLGEQLAPIKLSHDWLRGMGFRLQMLHGNDHYFLNNFHYYSSNRVIQLRFKPDQFPAEDFKTEVDHVHELQNLYFALKRKELVFNHNGKWVPTV